MYIFVGERRSPKAISMSVTWEDGRLCAYTLFSALSAAGVNPDEQVFINAYTDEGEVNHEALADIARWQRQGQIIIAMGEKAQRALKRAGVPYTPLIHPAARGAIRSKDRYRRHVHHTLTTAALDAQESTSPKL